MRIGILTQYYRPEIGAPQTRLSELARWFKARGHEVIVLTAMPNYPEGRIYKGYGGVYRREEIDGIQVIRAFIYPTKSVAHFKRLFNYFSFVISSILVGLPALPKLDYLLSESPPLFLGISGYLLSRLKGAKWIFNVSDLWPESAVRLGIVREGWALKMAEALESFCYRKAHLVTCQSVEILENIRGRFPNSSCYHLSNGVDTDLFGPEHRSPEVRQELFEGRPFVAVYAGLHGIAQGLGQLIDAAEQMRENPEFFLMFFGEGPEKSSLIQSAQSKNLKNIRFMDPLPHQRMPTLMASTDLALIPLKERLPGAVPSKLYEAMGSGVPVVLIANGEAASIVRQSQAGIVVNPGDVSDLVRSLRELIGDKNKLGEMGKNGRRAAVAGFNRKTIANAFVDFLENGA
ncbi:MAG TPA: glycosyltransferase family 4 protein [Acidobacteriota bacterium]|nr:glycosyltransferase family 4 protein [Acidobacteriota bacterium]